MTEKRMSWAEFKSGKAGEQNIDVEKHDSYSEGKREKSEFSKDEIQKNLIKKGMESLKAKTAPGAPPPKPGEKLTVEECMALREMGYTLLKEDVPRQKRKPPNPNKGKRKKFAKESRRRNRK